MSLYRLKKQTDAILCVGLGFVGRKGSRDFWALGEAPGLFLTAWNPTLQPLPFLKNESLSPGGGGIMMLAMSHCHSKVKGFVRAVLAGGFDRRREGILDPWEREFFSGTAG